MATDTRTHEAATAAGPRTVTTEDGLTVAFETYGPADGTPILFLHGSPGSRLLGAVFEEAARDANVRVVAPDRPGYGYSEAPTDFDLEAAATTLEPVLDAAGVDRVPVVAFSGGTLQALAATMCMPERVTAVELVSGAVPPQYGTGPNLMHRLLDSLATRAPRLLGGGYRLSAMLARRRDPTAVADLYTAPESPVALPDSVARLITQDFCAAFESTTAGAVHDSRFFASRWPLSLDALECPVQYWQGTADSLAPIEDVRALSEAVPAIAVETFEGHGHLGTLLASRRPLLSRLSTEPGRLQDSP